MTENTTAISRDAGECLRCKQTPGTHLFKEILGDSLIAWKKDSELMS